MRTAILTSGSLLLLASTPALADPCEVTVKRAPDDVRAAIEAWVAAEPSCSTTAEVRVVVTDDGYYLLAIGSDGNVHERTVPDAQSAGVLVASWIADDDAPVVSTPAPAQAQAAPTPVAPEAPAPLVRAPVVVSATPQPERWLTVGPTIVLVDQGLTGLRATVDLKRWRRWSVGVSAAFATTQDAPFETLATVRGIAEVAYTRTRGPWSVRTAIGLGAAASRYRMFEWDPSVEMTVTSTGGMGEASVLVSRRFRDRWAVTAGPLVDAWIEGDDLYAVDDLTLFVGLGRAL